jgi:dihydropyrimidinase
MASITSTLSSGLYALVALLIGVAADRLGAATTLLLAQLTAVCLLLGIYPQKGALCVGADVLIVDPSWLQPIAAVPPYSSVDYSIYEGLPGLYPRAVLARGRLLARDGVYVGPEGGGRFVPGTPARP